MTEAASTTTSEELGLSVQAARNLYTGRVDSRVVNLLLENPRFGLVTELAAEYFSGAIAAGLCSPQSGAVLRCQRNGESTEVEQTAKGSRLPGGTPGRDFENSRKPAQPKCPPGAVFA